MCKLSTVVCLYHIRGITKIDDCTLHKVYRAIATVFLIGVDKPFSGCFFNHGVLIEFLAIRTRIADNWHIFHIHLPLFPQFCWRIVVAQMLGFLLGGLHLLAVSKAYEHTVQRAGMSAISLLLSQFTIQLTDADVRVATMVVPDPA